MRGRWADEERGLLNVSIFGYWRKTITQVLQVRTQLRVQLERVKGQRKELARRLRELEIRRANGATETMPSGTVIGVERDRDEKRIRSVAIAQHPETLPKQCRIRKTKMHNPSLKDSDQHRMIMIRARVIGPLVPRQGGDGKIGSPG